MEKPFQGLATFLKSRTTDLSKPIGFFGVPYDACTSYRPGARFAPNAIRKASMMLTDGGHPVFEVEPRLHVTDCGDITCSNTDVAKSLEQITRAIQTHTFGSDESKRLLFAGGDHAITTAVLRAIAPRYDDLFVLHIDAHCDTWEDHFGDPLGHGTWVRNVIDEGLIKAHNMLQIGIRSPVDPDTRDWLEHRGGMVYSARQALRFSAHQLLRHVPKDKPVYVSFDIDALDPAYAPGTGTPEIAGLTPHWALDLIEGLAGHNVVGMDLVEVNPAYDAAEITAVAGATLLWTMAAVMAA